MDTEKEPLLPNINTPIRITSRQRPSTSLVTGYILVFLAGICQATRGFLFHVAEDFKQFPVVSTIFINSICFTFFPLLWITYFNLWNEFKVPRSTIVLLSFRGLCAAAGSILAFLAFARLPIGNYMTIIALSPVITSVLASLFLNDPFTFKDIIILTVNLFGVFLVAQPTISIGGTTALGTIFAFGVAFFLSMGAIIIRKMGTSVHYIITVLAVGVTCLPSVFFMTKQHFTDMIQSKSGLFIVIIASTISFITAALNSRGMQVIRPGIGLVVRTCNVPVSVALGALFLNEPVSLQLLIGASLVVGSICSIGLFKTKQPARRTIS